MRDAWLVLLVWLVCPLASSLSSVDREHAGECACKQQTATTDSFDAREHQYCAPIPEELSRQAQETLHPTGAPRTREVPSSDHVWAQMNELADEEAARNAVEQAANIIDNEASEDNDNSAMAPIPMGKDLPQSSIDFHQPLPLAPAPSYHMSVRPAEAPGPLCLKTHPNAVIVEGGGVGVGPGWRDLEGSVSDRSPIGAISRTNSSASAGRSAALTASNLLAFTKQQVRGSVADCSLMVCLSAQHGCWARTKWIRACFTEPGCWCCHWLSNRAC
eukprot:1348839-Rhodomonas_salina.1